MNAQIALSALALALAAGGAAAKLPPPSDEAKARAAEAAARTAWSDKVAAYQLCQSMDRVAASYLEHARAAGKTPQVVATPPCSDPGPFSYSPPESKPLEAAGAHSPPQTAATPPSTTQPAAAGPKP
ncbi:hypothetical protein [Pseudorhodoferax sp.]|uniref:hypothetical protein n=1 Tax=Pseudorhodoferax sp. TaxID=1993553 RepID=UPI002DD6574C|nr:hypothetical protein [Pseudorhodoferax sp.]